MAIRCLEGVNGSGKSYEGIAKHLLPALRAKRKVYCSIAGLNYQKIAENIGVELPELQTLLFKFTNEDMLKPGFFPQVIEHTDGHEEVIPGFVTPESLVIPDEVWRVWNRDKKVPAEHLNFWAMHRHINCDVVFLTQNFKRLHPELQVRTELRYKCRKMTIIGRPTQYQVLFYEEGETKSSHRETHTYDPAIFSLYKSGALANLNETSEGRFNALARVKKKALILLPVFLIALFYAGSFVVDLYNGKATFTKAGKDAQQKKEQANAIPSSPTSTASTVPSTASPLARPATTSTSEPWRIVAQYQAGNLPVFILQDEKGRYRTITSGNARWGAGDDVSIAIENSEADTATPWSTAMPTYRQQQQQQQTTK